MSKQTEHKNGRLLPLIYLFFPLMLCCQELAVHIFVTGPAGSKIVYPLFTAFCTGCILSMIWGAIPQRFIRNLAGMFITLFFVLFYQTHVVYHSVFVTYWAPFSTLSVAGQAFDYGGMIHDNAYANRGLLILLLLPLPLYILMVALIHKRPIKAAVLPAYVSGCIAAALLAVMLCKDPYMREAFTGKTDLSDSMENAGVLASSMADGLFAGNNGSLTLTSLPSSAVLMPSQASDTAAGTASGITTAPAANTPAGTASGNAALTADSGSEDTESFERRPHVMDIDFEALAENETNANIRNMHMYFASQEPSYTNKYTGMFEGFNLIWITVEGMSSYIIDEERTPTLYMMAHEGFDFKHFYTPLWYGSTSGGEWAALTGIPPGDGGYIAMEHSGAIKANMYFTPGKRFGALGYDCYGFHANYADYYGRNASHPNMGLKWIAYGTGYKGETNGKGLIWPESDLNLWNESTGFIDMDRPFFAYYMTISGHAQYNWGGNSMSRRHKELFDSLPYSDKSKAYLACEYEVELMLTQMLSDLEEAGIADKTVIVLCADHIPYNDMDICDELAGHELEKEFEQYENTLIIWSGAMDEPVAVDKYCSTIDILPTVLNLFDIEFDSRLMAGRDILSDSPQFVMFNGSRSFISNACMYDAGQQLIMPFEPFTAEDIDESYIKAVQEEIKNKARLASLILDNDYYDKLHLPLVEVDVLQ